MKEVLFAILVLIVVGHLHGCGGGDPVMSDDVLQRVAYHNPQNPPQ